MKNFSLETTTVWSFSQRGKWATHNPKYRGNFAPQIPRNALLRYTKEDDLILDPMVGGGTSLIEAKLLNRRSIGLDINPEAIVQTQESISFKSKHEPSLKINDTRNLDFIDSETIDFIITHPPYLNIIKYSKGEIDGDLSNISGVQKFCNELEKAVKEYFRVLKENSYISILIGDTRRNRHYIPLSYYVMELFLKNGFLLKEDIIKVQHNCSSTPYWSSMSKRYNFHLIMHEHFFVFRKPKINEDLSKFRYSYFK